jgi:YVTN family beta-propeller protein
LIAGAGSPFRRRSTVATRVVSAAIVIVGCSSLIMSACSGSPRPRGAQRGSISVPSTSSATASTTEPTLRVDRTYSEQALASLPAPLEDAVAATFGARTLLAGGLDANDSSTAQVVAVTAGANEVSGSEVIGALPGALHDAAGAGLTGSLYVFGGGASAGQLDGITRVDPSGATSNVGRLPAPSSDSTAAVVGTTAYVVGGYTGSKWLDTIVAFTPGSGAHVVAHLPTPIRYAAVGSAGGRLVIAGGSTPSARATTSVFVYDPREGTVTRIGDLPVALTHASAAGLGRSVLVVGGQDSTRTALASIVEIDPAAGRIRVAGHLLGPRSDIALTSDGNRLRLAGGHNATGTLSGISTIVATDARVRKIDVYAHDGANALAPAARSARSLVYVPNSESDTVDVIDQKTMKVVEHFAVGGLPQHITPSWDLRTLYVDNDHGNSLTPIDPDTGLPGPPIPVTDPYNLYFTPDGHFAIVVAEARNLLDFRDPQSLNLVNSLTVPCRGIDHMDFTADGAFALASCEFSGNMVVIDMHHQQVVRLVPLPKLLDRPQDVKLSPDGSIFYVADMANGGVWEIDAKIWAVVGFLPTGRGAHGLYPSRDARQLYVTNRDAGTVSVVDVVTRSVVATWTIPNGSPDMGGVSADGRVLWLSGRYNSEVYAISTTDGQLLARIPVGRGPHGLSVWPQPGRYSLGHTGLMR